MQVEGLYDCQYLLRDNKAVIYLFRRDAQGEKHIDQIEGFYPYFYVDADAPIPNDPRITKVQPYPLTTLNGKKVVKIYTHSPYNISELRELFQRTYEADVLFNLRYMIDNVDEVISTRLSVDIIDIETTMKYGGVDVSKAAEQITSISVYNNFLSQRLGKEVFNVFVWHPSITREEKQVNENETRRINIHKCCNERSMLQRFLEYQKIVRADVWMAWNMPFDFPYIIKRMQKHMLSYNELSPVGSVRIREKNDKSGNIIHIPFIHGVICFDSMYWLRRVKMNEFPSYALGAIAQAEVGQGKIQVDTPYQAWQNSWQDAVEYNVQDVNLVRLIEEKRRLLEWINQIRLIAKVNFQDVVYFSRVLDIFIMRKFKTQYVFPSKPPYEERTQALKGGYVQETVVGIHNNVILLDVQGLYPNLIKTFNLSYDTIDENGEIRIEYETLQDEKLVKTKVCYTNKKIGLCPAILDDFLLLRDKYKEQLKQLPYGSPEYLKMYDSQFALKFLINSAFGAFALPSFRFYDVRVANSITYLGRAFNELCRKKVIGRFGYEILAADTDSIFVKLSPTDDPSLKGEEIKKYINNEVALEFVQQYGITHHTLYTEMQDIFTRCLLSTKKRWAGARAQGGLIIKGLQTRRSDYSKMSRELQERVLNMLLTQDVTIEQLISLIKEEVRKIKNGNYTYEEIGVPTKIEKEIELYSNLPKKRAAQWSVKHLQLSFTPGSKPLFIWVKARDTDGILFYSNQQLEKVQQKFQLDLTRTIKRNITMVLDSVLTPMGWTHQLHNAILGQYTLNNYSARERTYG